MALEKQIVSLCPKAEVEFKDGRFHLTGEIQPINEEKCESDYKKGQKWQIGNSQYYYCEKCNGRDHHKYGKILPELTYPLHPKHPLQLVYFRRFKRIKECYCCENILKSFFYYCPVCEFCMNVGCVEKTTHLHIDCPKKHEHTLALFPRQTSLTCNVCALDNSRGPIYMCPPCDFVLHKRCRNLPSVIKISRHGHRISFKHSFVFGDWSCGVCRKMVNSDYGGYSCNTEDCSYVAHSRCATRKNVWDGKELEGVPEDTDAVEDERPPYVEIGDRIIRHFRHEDHLLKLEEDTDRVFDENKRCQACIMPIYDGKFYSCTQCGFILHKICANLSRTTHHALHPHPLNLVAQYNNYRFNLYDICTACNQPCTGFMYKCKDRRCHFRLHIQCATISEPFIHESHKDPLFLTSEPGERRLCQICKRKIKETFNCIECDFSLCFRCAILPHKVKYKHDEHLLSLSYGEEIDATATYWCEVCESKIHQEERFYKCDECCVTIHLGCLLGKHLYIKPGSFVCHKGDIIDVLLNNRMSRPSCVRCSSRCEDKLVFKYSRSLSFCSLRCFTPSVLNFR